MRAVDLVDVVDAADVRVGDLARHPHFGMELRQARGIAIDVGGQELERDRLSELQIVGAVDLAHPAAADAPDDPIAAAEQRSGRKAPMVDGAGRGQPSRRRWRARVARVHAAAAARAGLCLRDRGEPRRIVRISRSRLGRHDD